MQFLIGFIVYTILAITSYSDTLKSSGWYYWIGLTAALIANSAWLHLAKQEPSASRLVVLGLYWDVMLLVAYMLVPILFFEARLTAIQGAGLVLILCGIILTKI